MCGWYHYCVLSGCLLYLSLCNSGFQGLLMLKPTHTNLYLYQKSHHHPANKYSVLSSLVHRAKALCDQEPLASELTFLTKVLQQNGGSVFRVPLSTVYLEPRKEGLGLVDVKTKCITFSLDQYIWHLQGFATLTVQWNRTIATGNLLICFQYQLVSSTYIFSSGRSATVV